MPTRKNLETLIQDGVGTLSGTVLTLNPGLQENDIAILTNEEPDINITKIIVNCPSAYIISHAEISLKEIIVRPSFASLHLKNISDDCKIVVKEKVKIGILTNTDKNKRLSLDVPSIELNNNEE
jgi:hypothetical protein